MKLILQQDVDDLGFAGEVVKVRPGYARNFLLPNRFAVEATPNNMRRVEKLKKETERRHLELKGNAEKVANQLQGITLTMERRVGEENKLYGSVTTMDIAEALEKAGFKIQRKNILIGEPIKSLGDHVVKIRMFKDVVAEVKVHVKSDAKEA